jgi:Fur family ferric uptake transcriptional regulator
MAKIVLMASTLAEGSGPRVRVTRQKRAVATLLDETDEFTSAQDLHARLRASGDRVGLATVYSQLRALAGSGEIDSVRGDSGETLYRRCGSPVHHHHLVCRRCGHTVELDAQDLESLARRLGEEHGFSQLDHVVEISGVCAHCSGESG